MPSNLEADPMKTAIVIIVIMMTGIGMAAPAAAFPTEKNMLMAQLRPAVPLDRVKNVDELHQKWQDIKAGRSRALLLDVREPFEFQAGHIEGARNLSVRELHRAPTAIDDPGAEVWIYCRTANRSAFAVGQLLQAGYANVYMVGKHPDSTEGGITGWLQRSYPVVVDGPGQAAGQVRP